MNELFGYWLIGISVLGLIYCIGNIIRLLTQSNPYPNSHHDFLYAGLLAASKQQKVKKQ